MTEKARNAVHPEGVRTGAGAANCLSVGQRHLCDNPLLKEPLTLSQIKTMVLGHRARHHAGTSSLCI
jgi:phosphoketolase